MDLIFQASFDGNVARVRALLGRGEGVNRVYGEHGGSTLLYAAAARKERGVVDRGRPTLQSHPEYRICRICVLLELTFLSIIQYNGRRKEQCQCQS